MEFCSKEVFLYLYNSFGVYVPFMRVTDDNKGVKYYHSKPYCIPIQSGFIPLVAGSLKDQIALLVYCFLHFKSMDIR